MLFARKIRAGCLLLGMLVFGGGMMQMSGRLHTEAETPEQTVSEESAGPSKEDPAYDSVGNSIDRMEEQYWRLREEEARISAALEEFIETRPEDDDGTAAEELGRTLWHLRLQEQVLKARLEEMGQMPSDESVKNP